MILRELVRLSQSIFQLLVMLKSLTTITCKNQLLITILEKWIEKGRKKIRSYDKKRTIRQPQAVVNASGEGWPGDAIVVTDVGNTKCGQLNTITYQNERPIGNSGGLGTMGFRSSCSHRGKLPIQIKSCSFRRWWWFPNDQSGIGNLEYL